MVRVHQSGLSKSRYSFAFACRLLEIAHTVLCVQIIYHYLIIHFGNTDSGLDRIVWYVAHIEILYVTPLKIL